MEVNGSIVTFVSDGSTRCLFVFQHCACARVLLFFFAYFALRVLVSCPYLLSRTHLPGVTRTAAPLLSHTNTLEHTRGVLFRWKADLQLCQKTDETSE